MSNNNGKPICLLDCDGVLADFIGGCADLIYPDGGDQLELIFRNSSKPVPYSLDEMFNDVEVDFIFRHMTPWFWASLRKHSWADDLVRMLSGAFGHDNIVICTSAGYMGNTNFFSSAAAGKERWIMEHYPQFSTRVVFCYEKELLASSRHVLIDDGEQNVNGFVANGGRAILFPAYWNSKWEIYDSKNRRDAILRYIQNELDKILGGV